MAHRKSSRLNKGKGATSDGPTVVIPPVTSTVDPAIAKLITDSIAAAMTHFESRVEARNNSHSGGTGNSTDSGTGRVHTPGAGGSGSGRNTVIIPEDNPISCTYKEFLVCRPVEYKGTEGAIETLRWIEKTEAVFKVSGTAEKPQS
jgi:hypothetical protein